MPVQGYLRVLRTQWVAVAAGLLLGLVVAGAATVWSPPVYAADVTVYVSARPDGPDPSSAFDAGRLAEQRVQSYRQLVTSDRVAQRVIDELGLTLTARELAAEVDVSVVEETALLTASVTDGSAEFAAAIANALGDGLVRLVAELEQPPDPLVPPALRAEVVTRAVVPAVPVSPKPALNLALGVLVGLAVGYGTGIVRDAVRSQRSAEPSARAADPAPVEVPVP